MEKRPQLQRAKSAGGTPAAKSAPKGAAKGAAKSSAAPVKKEIPAGKPSTRDPKKPTPRDDPSRKQNFDGTFFAAIRSPKRQYFTIHPEWVSENLSVSRMTLKEKTQTYPPRRCKSAPPPRSRNPITWLSQPNLAESQAATRPSSRNAEATIKPQKATRLSKINNDGTYFSAVGTPRRQCYTVHPEWASEGRSYARQSNRPECRTTNTFENIYGRRSRSAPALRSRNPITWE